MTVHKFKSFPFHTQLYKIYFLFSNNKVLHQHNKFTIRNSTSSFWVTDTAELSSIELYCINVCTYDLKIKSVLEKRWWSGFASSPGWRESPVPDSSMGRWSSCLSLRSGGVFVRIILLRKWDVERRETNHSDTFTRIIIPMGFPF